MKRPASPYLVAITLLALIAFAVRAVSLDAQSLWRDEVDALRFATAPLEEVLSSFTRPGWNGPLYFLLLRGWIAPTGTSEYAMRFFSLLFGVLCVPLVYVLGCRLFDRPTGLIAALLVTASPYLTWYSQEVKMYSLVPALALLAIYGLRRALGADVARLRPEGSAAGGSGWCWWVVQTAATTLALYCHILAALLIPVQVLLCFAWWPQARRRWAGALASLACLVLPYLPLAAWQVPLLFQARETGFGHFSLGEMVKILLDGWSVGDFGTFSLTAQWFRELAYALFHWWQDARPWLWPPVAVRVVDAPASWLMSAVSGGWSLDAVLMLVLALWGGLSFLIGLIGKRLRATIALLFWLAIPLLAVWTVSQWQPLFTDRYLIWSSLAFYLLIASGLALLWRLGGRGRWAAVLLLCAVLASNGVNQWWQAITPGKSDFRAAAAYVTAHYRTAEESRPATSRPPAQPLGEQYVFRSYLPLTMARYQRFGGLIVFQIPYCRYTFDYYFPHVGYPWADGLYTNHRRPDGSHMMSEEEAALAMERMTEGYDEVWLVASEMDMWDERHLVKKWLDGNAQLMDEHSRLWVDVYRYVK